MRRLPLEPSAVVDDPVGAVAQEYRCPVADRQQLDRRRPRRRRDQSGGGCKEDDEPGHRTNPRSPAGLQGDPPGCGQCQHGSNRELHRHDLEVAGRGAHRSQDRDEAVNEVETDACSAGPDRRDDGGAHRGEHGGAEQRQGDEVDQNCSRDQGAEVGGHQRRGGCLGDQWDGNRAGDESRPREDLGQDRRPPHQGGGDEDRELKARVGDQERSCQEKEQGGEEHRRHGQDRASDETGAEVDDPHEGGAHGRWCGAREEGIGWKRRQHDDPRGPRRGAEHRRQQPHGGANQPHVQPADGENVGEPRTPPAVPALERHQVTAPEGQRGRHFSRPDPGDRGAGGGEQTAGEPVTEPGQ